MYLLLGASNCYTSKLGCNPPGALGRGVLLIIKGRKKDVSKRVSICVYVLLEIQVEVVAIAVLYLKT